MRITDTYELQLINGESLLIPVNIETEDKEIITLDPITAYLWENVAGRKSFTIETLIDLLQKEYDVDKETAYEDCKLIIETWLDMKIAII